MASFRDRFKELREKRGWTQDDAAERLGIARSTIAGYEGEKSRVPRPETLDKIAQDFGVSVDYLLGRDESNEQQTRRLSDKQKRLLDFVKNLPEEEQDYFLGLAERIVKGHP